MKTRRFPQGLVLMLSTLMMQRAGHGWTVMEIQAAYHGATGDPLAKEHAASSLDHMTKQGLATKTIASTKQRFYRLTSEGEAMCYWASAALARAWGCERPGQGTGERDES